MKYYMITFRIQHSVGSHSNSVIEMFTIREDELEEFIRFVNEPEDRTMRKSGVIINSLEISKELYESLTDFESSIGITNI